MLLAAALILRSFVLAPFLIPSESMLPSLYVGDALFISKWDYGWSRAALPLGGSLPDLPPLRHRWFAKSPARGDVVVFEAPPADRQDYVKRVIGLPGDRVQLRHGQVILDGRPVPRDRIADFTLPLSPNYGAAQCPARFRERDPRGAICRYRAYRETLPSGANYVVLDRGEVPAADETPVFTVPAGHLFLLGDNRDVSGDSRFPARNGGAIGMVPIANVEGKARLLFFSSDGSAHRLQLGSWLRAVRWSRIGVVP